jgi:hypothetical protein
MAKVILFIGNCIISFFASAFIMQVLESVCVSVVKLQFTIVSYFPNSDWGVVLRLLWIVVLLCVWVVLIVSVQISDLASSMEGWLNMNVFNKFYKSPKRR